jgi:hypothetical protein
MHIVGPSFASLAVLFCTLSGAAQILASPPAERPLPDVPTLMHRVESNERKVETLQQSYIYDESTVFELRDSHEAAKKTETSDLEVFWLDGVPVRRTLKKNGKALSPDEIRNEDERIDNAVKKARERREKADANGKETDPRGHDEITFSRLLELGTFSNPRREVVNGRDTILVDFQGDPKAKTHNNAEGIFRELAGTVWVDERDQTLQHLEGHFDHDFKVAGGIAASVKQGSWFKGTWIKINNEVWLPASFEADGHARYLLFFSLNGHFKGHTSDYRKFKATSTILPGIATVPDAEPDPAATAAPPNL